jgi:hypothetical protein
MWLINIPHSGAKSDKIILLLKSRACVHIRTPYAR